MQLGQSSADAVDGLNDIGFRQFADHQQNSRFSVGHPGVTDILNGVGHRRDITQTYGGAIIVMNDQRLISGGSFQRVICLYLPAVGRVFNRPLWTANVSLVDSGAHRIQRDALIKQGLRV